MIFSAASPLQCSRTISSYRVTGGRLEMPRLSKGLLARTRIGVMKMNKGRALYCRAEVENNTEKVTNREKKDIVGNAESNGGSEPNITLSQAQKEKICHPNEYPTEEASEEVAFFPVRDPGNFPAVDIETPIPLKAEEKEYDPLRDGILRYLGYANELGEAFAVWLPPGGVPLSYAVAVGYVLVDTGDKGFKAARTAKKELDSIPNLDSSVLLQKLTTLLAGERALDTVVWQLLASVIIPGYTIHTVVAVVHFLLIAGLHLDNPALLYPSISHAADFVASTTHTNTETVLALVNKSVPTFCGLTAIPFIVHPIDSTVHAMLNMSMRPALRKYLCKNGQGKLAGLSICDDECIVNDFPILDENNTLVEAFTKSFDEED